MKGRFQLIALKVMSAIFDRRRRCPVHCQGIRGREFTEARNIFYFPNNHASLNYRVFFFHIRAWNYLHYKVVFYHSGQCSSPILRSFCQIYRSVFQLSHLQDHSIWTCQFAQVVPRWFVALPIFDNLIRLKIDLLDYQELAKNHFQAGWTPSQFKRSRTNHVKLTAQPAQGTQRHSQLCNQSRACTRAPSSIYHWHVFTLGPNLERLILFCQDYSLVHLFIQRQSFWPQIGYASSKKFFQESYPRILWWSCQRVPSKLTTSQLLNTWTFLAWLICLASYQI